MLGQHVWTHVHTQYTNGTLNECPNKPEDFIKKVKEMDSVKGVIFTEHGHALGWFKKYEAIKKAGLKYIHAVEGYVCNKLEDKENNHILIYALNYDGFEEVNEIISTGFQRDGHYYRRPRILIDELLQYENIAISSACSGGVLDMTQPIVFNKLLKWGIKNKNKFFLEIQPHQFDRQREINSLAIELSRKHGLMTICSNDLHYTDYDYKIAREILEKNKETVFTTEDECDLSVKTYEQQKSDLIKNHIPENVVVESLANTVRLYDMCSEYEIDCSFKYPQIYENPRQILVEKCIKRLQELGISSAKYMNRINMELDAMAKLGSESYICLFSEWLTDCKNNDIYITPSRGSASGSLVTYLVGITDIDPIMWKTSWDRFMNIRKQSLADIDLDIPPALRHMAKEWFYKKHGLNCSEIMAYTKSKAKGTCDIVSRVEKFNDADAKKFKEAYVDIRKELNLESVVEELLLDPDETELEDEKTFSEDADMTLEELMNKMNEKDERFGEAIKKVVMLEGCIVSISSHPAGVLVSDLDIRRKVGIITMEDKKAKSEDGSPVFKQVSQCDMKELEAMGYVKADALGLACAGAISRTCNYLNIPFPDPQTFDFNDEAVWQDMTKSPVCIFQFENPQAHEYLVKALSVVKTKDKLETMSMMSGLIRPSGASTRGRFLNGELGDNGHPEVDKKFSDTMQYIVYQEQIIDFLVEFCGYDYSEADITRRLIAKKMELEKFEKQMNIIKSDFADYFPKHYECDDEQVEIIMDRFLSIVLSARDYGFSRNHAITYTMLGYICAWFRYYHPIEYMTACLNEYNDKPQKMKTIYNFIQEFNIAPIKKPKFPYVSLDYMYKDGVIYEGMSGAKHVGKNVERAFDEIRNGGEFTHILDVWKYMKDNYISGAGKKEWLALNKMAFFSELGKQKPNNDLILALTNPKSALLKYDPKQTEKTRITKYNRIKDFYAEIPQEDFSDFEQAMFDLEILGHTDKRFESFQDVFYVLDSQKPYSLYILTLYDMATGEIHTYKASPKDIGTKLEKDKVIQVTNKNWTENSSLIGYSKTTGMPKFEKNGTFNWRIKSYEYIKLEE